jgi:hypothetical protein
MIKEIRKWAELNGIEMCERPWGEIIFVNWKVNRYVVVSEEKFGDKTFEELKRELEYELFHGEQ